VELDWIATALAARAAHRADHIQSLWSGYGELFRVALDGARASTAIVKWARPPASAQPDASHQRKCRSYDVELAFYRNIAPRCDATCRVPELYAARGDSEVREWVLVLEDLDAAGYPARTDEASPDELERVLAWLASFHARFVGERFDLVWPRGTYWQLDTRRDELPRIADRALRDVAEDVAHQLASARYQTLLHGDAKDANFCFARDRSRVAAVDFQYTGHGCGIVDVAYLLHGRGDEPADGVDRPRLDVYFECLRAALAPRWSASDIAALEREWRALYPVARLDFCRFLAGWRPAMWQRDVRGQQFVRRALSTR
jgi:hypothetical protein